MTEERTTEASDASDAQPLLGEMSSHPSSLPPATFQQMEEMLKHLRDIAPDNPSGAVTAYGSDKSFLSRMPNLPVCFHPVRKLIGSRRNLTMIGLNLLLVITFYIVSGSGSNEFSSSGQGGIMASFSIGSSKDTTLYYNTKKGEEDKALPLAGMYDGKSVICLLVTNNDKDVADLLVALQSLAFLQGDKALPSPVLIFNEDNLSDEQIYAIRSSTNRPISFPTVDLTTFPPGFKPNDFVNQAQHFDVTDRLPWGYYQMIRFFLTKIWHHPSVERYETIMRLDSDSCFKSPNSYLPRMMYDHIDYHSQYVGVEPEAGKQYLEGLFDFIVEYMERVQKSPGNVMLWHFIETTWTLGKTLPVMRTNLEISKRSYMMRADIQKWHNTLTEEEPYGLFRYRWGDSIVRFLEAAVFATDSNVLTVRHEGYFHKRECSKIEVEQALKQYKLL